MSQNPPSSDAMDVDGPPDTPRNNPRVPVPSSSPRNRPRGAVRSSSPLAFPPTSDPRLSSSGLRPSQVSSPLHFPASSPAAHRGSQRGAQRGAQPPLFAPPSSSQAMRSDTPLFFPDTPTATPRNVRGDIHSLAPRSHPSHPTSLSSTGLQPLSTAQTDPAGPDPEAPEPVTVVWGTTVTLKASMDAFRRFLDEFSAADRVTYDSAEGRPNTYAALDPATLIYQELLGRMRDTSQTNLNLDVEDLRAFAWVRSAANPDNSDAISAADTALSDLCHNLINYPQEIIPILDQVLKDAAVDWAWAHLGSGAARADNEARARIVEGAVFKVRPFLPRASAVNLRTLNPADIDRLISVSGLVIRATPLIPDMKLAFFRCGVCGHTLSAEIDRGTIAEPRQCPREACAAQASLVLIHNRSEFADRQVIRLQETPDAVPDGQTPHTVSLCVYDELVDSVKPGDRVHVSAIFRSVPVRVNARMRSIRAVFRTYLDVVHVAGSGDKRLGKDLSTRSTDEEVGGVSPSDLTGERSEDGAAPFTSDARFSQDSLGVVDSQGSDLFAPATPRAGAGADATNSADSAAPVVPPAIAATAARPDLFAYLCRSLAPSIFDMDDVKRGVLLMLFGGTHKLIRNGQSTSSYRSDINVLLVGDPGTSKSQILQFVHKIAPRGVYTSGRGSSAVGLTAYVTRDPDSRQLVLESGALVLSDGGVCCIDEFDKMSDAARSVLHEVMEQQTVSVAKAGIITSLNARASIIAAANPVGSKYNLQWPVAKNIDLPPTLISRFDLLYLVLDRVDEKADRRLAAHLLGLYIDDAHASRPTDTLSLQELAAYISYARDHVRPRLSEEAGTALAQAYVDMRSAGAGSGAPRITATTRQLESMIRLAEAHAKMRLAPIVEASDVSEAVRLIRAALKDAATDPRTGLIDLDLLTTGQGQHARRLQQDLMREIVRILSSSSSQQSNWSELLRTLAANSSIPIDPGDFADAVHLLESEAVVRVVGLRDARIVRMIPGATFDVV